MRTTVEQNLLMIKTSPGFSDSSSVWKHANSTRYFSEISPRYDSWRLVVDSDFEASWTPINELNRAVGLDSSDRSIDILRNDITTIEKTYSHILAMTRITFNHLIAGFKTGIGYIRNRERFVIGLISRDDRSIGSKREVNTRIRNQVCLEFSKINVESTIETQRGSDWWYNLKNRKVRRGNKEKIALPEKSDGWDSCKRDVLHQDFCDRYRRWLRCRPWRRNRNVPKLYE